MAISQKSIFIGAGNELRMQAQESGTVTITFESNRGSALRFGIGQIREPNRKARNQEAKASRRQVAGKPTYRRRQASARASKAKRESGTSFRARVDLAGYRP
jgi:hypothetical protein